MQFKEMTQEYLKTYKIEQINIRQIMFIQPSTEKVFKQKNQHVIELHFFNEHVIYLASFDQA
jgi:hypothetical protein